jgi:exonuclease SbcC
MLPVKITIKGLYSFREEQTIEFNKLLGAKLFGIFGQVGSGKSTIIEAITLALYEQSERLNKNERNYNMMNLRSDDLLVDFEFIASTDGKKYRFIFKAVRNKKQFDKVEVTERRKLREENGEWLPVENITPEELLGLSYDNFRRTIIIPQGKFSEFLQLGHADRTRMLKEIFSLQKFEFGDKVSVLESRNQLEIENRNGQLLQLGYLSDDEYNALVNKNKTLQFELKNQQIQLIQKEAEIKLLQRAKELNDKKLHLQKELMLLQGKSTEMDELEDKIKKYDACIKEIKPLLNISDYLNTAKLRIDKDLTSLQSTKNDISINFPTVRERYLQLKEKQNLKTSTDEKDDLAHLLVISECREKLDQQTLRTEKGRQLFKDKENTSISLKSELKQLEGAQQWLKSQLPDTVLSNRVQECFIGIRNINSRLQELKLEKARLMQEISERDMAVSSMAEHLSLPAVTIAQNYLPEPESIPEPNTEINEKKLLLQEKIQHLAVDEKVRELTEMLKDGEPCPVCGSTNHPNSGKHHLPVLAESVQDLKNQLVRLEEESKKVQGLMLKSAESKGEVVTLRRRHDEIIHEEERLQNEIIQLKDSLAEINGAPTNEQEFEEFINKLADLRGKLSDTESDIAALRNELEIVETDKEKYSKELTKIDTDLNTWRTEILTRRKLLKNLGIEFLENNSREDIQNRIKELEIWSLQTEKELNETEELYNKLNKENIKTESALSEADRQLQDIVKKITENDYFIQQKLQELGLSERSEAIKILSGDFNSEEATSTLSSFRMQLGILKTQLSEVRTGLELNPYDDETYTKMNSELSMLKDTMASLQKQETINSEEIIRYQEKLDASDKIKEELKVLERRAERIKKLQSLFKGSGFVKYVSGIFLEDLCRSANQRFHKLTKQTLQLELDEDNSFIVRDLMNDGKTRSIKTLSGGQMFQASLSLALSLADNINRQSHARGNFFFLDEGFGSLDKESLREVFDTLKQLRHENRHVGLISHVEEMQQEIDVYVEVRKDDERGSLVRPNWE